MSKLRYLPDEDVRKPRALIDCLLREEPAIDIMRVGDPGAPPRATKDPELLIAGELLGRAIVSYDRSTLRRDVGSLIAAGRHTSGVFFMRLGFSVVEYVETLVLL